MTKWLLGKPVAEVMQAEIAKEAAAWRAQGVVPTLAVVLVDGDPASRAYARAKQRAGRALGIDMRVHAFPEAVAEVDLIHAIQVLNDDTEVHGILVELPLPDHLSAERVTAAIEPTKDVDGLTRQGWPLHGALNTGLYPATPLACLRLLEHYGYSVGGRHVVLVGCGKTVGMPLLHLLIAQNATVTVCHAGTPDIGVHLRQAEIGFVAVGRPGLITADMVHPDLVLVDAGINETPDHRIVGDVAPDAAERVAAVTPTPGGVGVVTTAQLFSNLLTAVRRQFEVAARGRQPVLV